MLGAHSDFRPKAFLQHSTKEPSQKSTLNSTRCDIVTRPAILEWLAHDLQNVALKLGQLVEKKHAVVAQGDLAGPRHRASADEPTSLMVTCGERNDRVPTSPRLSSNSPETL